MIETRALADGAVLIEIDNPPANALGHAARQAFHATLDRIETDETVRVLAITGRGRAFCSGDDLKEQEAAQAEGLDTRKAQLADFAALVDRIEAFRVPVIAAINGYCLGGGFELALACDIRIAAASASFVCAGVNVGLMASAYRLPRLIGVARAKHLLLTGAPIDAEAAERFGVVTAVHKDDMLLPATAALAERVASRAPLSVAATRAIASRAADLTRDEAAALTGDTLSSLVASADHAEALKAFREKRPPVFKGQ